MALGTHSAWVWEFKALGELLRAYWGLRFRIYSSGFQVRCSDLILRL